MKAFITGVAGFIGSHLAERLLRDGHQITGIDSLSDYYDVNLKVKNLDKLSHPDFRFVQGDLNLEHLAPLVDGADVVFHEAGQPGVRRSWGSDFAVYTEANVNATQRLLEAALSSASLQQFVYASSSSVYGEASTFPTTEAAPTAPMSPYGVTKLAGEHLCSLYGRNFGLPTVALRYFTVYGPGQRPDMAFTRFVKAAVRDDEIQIYGDGLQIRDFTFIDDIVEANLAASLGRTQPGAVYNVSGGGHASVMDVLGILERLAGQKLNVVHYPAVPGDVTRTGGDTTRARRDLGWTPKVQLVDGLAAQFAWAREQFGKVTQGAPAGGAALSGDGVDGLISDWH